MALLSTVSPALMKQIRISGEIFSRKSMSPLWLSFENFGGRCSLKTWVYRVAHNTATSVVIRRKARAPAFVGLDQVEASLQGDDVQSLDQQETLERLWALIQKLKPSDKQIILLYLEGMDAASIGDITGFSASNVAVVPCFLPGGVVLIISIALGPRPQGLIMASIVTAFFASLFTFFAKLNQRAARRLQRQIDELGR